MKNLTTLQLIEQTIGQSPMDISVAQAALCDNLLRAHQEEVRRMEEDLRQQVRRILGAQPKPVIVAGRRFHAEFWGWSVRAGLRGLCRRAGVMMGLKTGRGPESSTSSHPRFDESQVYRIEDFSECRAKGPATPGRGCWRHEDRSGDLL